MYDNMCAHVITGISFITSVSDLLFPETKILSDLRSRTEKIAVQMVQFQVVRKMNFHIKKKYSYRKTYLPAHGHFLLCAAENIFRVFKNIYIQA
jgi:hypothetical protein